MFFSNYSLCCDLVVKLSCVVRDVYFRCLAFWSGGPSNLFILFLWQINLGRLLELITSLMSEVLCYIWYIIKEWYINDMIHVFNKLEDG
jgi:hypothetical protein